MDNFHTTVLVIVIVLSSSINTTVRLVQHVTIISTRAYPALGTLAHPSSGEGTTLGLAAASRHLEPFDDHASPGPS